MAWHIAQGNIYLPQSIVTRAEKDKALWGCVKSHYYRSNKEQEHYIVLEHLTDEQLSAFVAIANKTNNKRFARMCQAVIDYDGPIPSFDAAYAMVLRWFQKHVTGGWVYARRGEYVYPYVFRRAKVHIPDERTANREDKPYVQLEFEARSMTSFNRYRGTIHGGGNVERTLTLHPADLTRRKVLSVLNGCGFELETQELRDQYLAQLTHMENHILGQFGNQFRRGRDDRRPGSKVLMVTKDTAMSKAMELYTLCPTVRDPEDGEMGAPVPIPVHADVAYFDLASQSFGTTNVCDLTPYEYDPGLADKLILPESHMDMLDVLTTNTDAFLSDIIEGKSAGNVILCKGRPGVGKTLTAEVYSEIVGKPIYNVHSGALGIKPDEVEDNLKKVFKRVQEWDCILLLDEADVFVCERGANLVQNAIVSVFLRVLEYFEGLMFMTTNRSDNIDDAIISRCAAIIDYGVPTPADMRAVWGVMAAQ